MIVKAFTRFLDGILVTLIVKLQVQLFSLQILHRNNVFTSKAFDMNASFLMKVRDLASRDELLQRVFIVLIFADHRRYRDVHPDPVSICAHLHFLQ